MSQRAYDPAPERVYVTRYREYHFRGAQCVAVRDKTTNQWCSDHQALGKRLAGGLQKKAGGTISYFLGRPEVGDRLCFENDLLTSPVIATRRPSHETAAHYVRML